MRPNKIVFMPSDDRTCVEANVYRNEEEDSVLFCDLSKERAIEAAVDLLKALAAIGVDQLDIHNAFEAAELP